MKKAFGAIPARAKRWMEFRDGVTLDLRNGLALMFLDVSLPS
jgi:hypothetical protein